MKVSFAKPQPQPAPVQPPPRAEEAEFLVPPRAPVSARRKPSRLPWYLLLLLAASPLIYFGGKIAQASLRLDAPGFLRRDHIAAYVPQAHAQYAAPGRTATVLFPDGEQLRASVTGAAEPGASQPQPGSTVGLAVRMDFVDPGDRTEVSGMSDGLPVRVRFQRPWIELLPQRWLATARGYWHDARERFRELRTGDGDGGQAS